MTPRTKVVLPVHLFGQCANIEALGSIAAAHGAALVEDAAQALGARCRGADGAWQHAGTLGATGCYSFFPSKNLGAFGDGGMIVTRDAALAERLRLLRVHGGRQMYHHRYVGWNSRLDALQAAVLRVKLPHLDRWSAARAENARRYDELFAARGLAGRGDVTLPGRSADSTHIFNQYTLRVARRDALAEHLRARQIGHAIYYPVPLHRQECFAELGYREGDFPVAERACREVLSLPVFPELGAGRQERIVDAIADFYG
jgi:dTDP-4-amino-4,6-dideoxygalactose transaminase